MALNLVNLDTSTRSCMLEEIVYDIAGGKLYYGPRLSPVGVPLYPELLRIAVRTGTDESLATELRVPGRLNETEERRKPKGGTTTAKVPINAPEVLAEGEFNRFYMRGLCLRAIKEGISEVVVYRAKEVANPRPESTALIGKRLPVKQLLDDLRASIGTDTALRLPPGPNSGLSVKLP